jgi:hypothetical protein
MISRGVEEVPTQEPTLDECREARELLLAQADSRDLRKSAHDREREDVVVVHRHRRTIKRALDRLAVTMTTSPPRWSTQPSPKSPIERASATRRPDS